MANPGGDNKRYMRQFLLFVFALIVPAFALWTLFAGPIAMPVVGLVNLILGSWFPQVVDGLIIQGGDILLMTRFGELNGVAVPPEQSEYQLGFRINPAVLTYSLPFYATLHFATQKDEYLGGFLMGVMALYPCILIGLVCLCLKELMLNLGDVFFKQPGVFVPNGDVIALLYQLNVLIVPTLAPMLIWAWQSRETPLFTSVLKLNPAGSGAESDPVAERRPPSRHPE